MSANALICPKPEDVQKKFFLEKNHSNWLTDCQKMFMINLTTSRLIVVALTRSKVTRLNPLFCSANKMFYDVKNTANLYIEPQNICHSHLHVYCY